LNDWLISRIFKSKANEDSSKLVQHTWPWFEVIQGHHCWYQSKAPRPYATFNAWI